MVAISHVIDQQANTARIVGNDDVGVAVVVDVAKGGAPTDFHQIEHAACAIGHVFETAANIPEN